MGDTGLEPFSENPLQLAGNKGLNNAPPDTQKTARVQNPVHIMEVHPDLRQVIEAWNNLPEHIIAAIKALIQTHITE